MTYLSIVTTLYKSANYVEEFHERVFEILSEINVTAEIIFVDDGSPDNSAEICKKLIRKDSRVILINLSRNHGHHKALYAGVEFAKGSLVFLIDSDLEEPPELLKEFLLLQQKTSADMVYGVQSTRKGGIFERLSGKFFYRVFNSLSRYHIPENLSTIRLMTRRYVTKLLLHRDQAMFLPGILSAVGHKQVEFQFKKLGKNSSSYSLIKKLTMFVDSITSFSAMPLFVAFYLGIIISTIGFCGVIGIIILKLLFIDFALGWSSLVASIWLVGGGSILSIGLVGIYVGRIMDEVKPRPLYIIENINTSTNLDETNLY
jgi:putative glycosyltransferase